jgi:ubiquinone/menaquinone biosynthesis C-methylase UbiE
MPTLDLLFAGLARDPSDAGLLSTLRALHDKSGSEIHSRVEQDDFACRNALTRLLAQPVASGRWLTRLAVAQVRNRHRLHESRRIDAALLTDLANDPLCLALLNDSLNVDVELERCLVRARHACLADLTSDAAPEPLLAALAMQAWNNEYLWEETAEETAQVAVLAAALDAAIRDGDFIAVTKPLLQWAMYRPLANLAAADVLAPRPLANVPPVLKPLWQRTLLAPREEAVLREAMPALAHIHDAASQAAQTQNEENPYPRWLRLSVGQKSLLEQIRGNQPAFAWPASFQKPVQILIAGCGTGQHPLALAMANRDAEVLAFDLSAASLAYAQRMARELKIENVRFLQGDLLQLPKLKRRFHHIECVGVLHELGDQQAAWESLTEVLHPGGTLRIGVTGKLACLPLTALRAKIAREGVAPTLAGVRAFRERLLCDQKSAAALAPIVAQEDFFSVSMVRHLFFPTRGYQYTLAELEQRATSCGLRLLGYRLPRQVQRHVARPSGMPTFAQWRSLETAYAGSFGMFQCWLHLPCQ